MITLIREGGVSAVTFKAVTARTSLSPASLVQRYGNRDGMIDAALHAGFDALEAATARAMLSSGSGPQCAHQLLFQLSRHAGGPGDLSILHQNFARPALSERASDWRMRMEQEIGARLGDDRQGAVVFAGWQGALLWSGTGSMVSMRELLDGLVS